MNINILFVGIIASLLAIFLFFQPLDIKKQKFDEIPVFELESFKLIELNEKGLTTIMDGDKGIRYTDRYIVYNINYTDNSKEYIANMVANEGLYKNNIIDLKGDILYSREKGISFSTQEAVYNKDTNLVVASNKFTSTLGKSTATGTYIEYNNVLGTVKSKNISINYKLKER